MSNHGAVQEHSNPAEAGAAFNLQKRHGRLVRAGVVLSGIALSVSSVACSFQGGNKESSRSQQKTVQSTVAPGSTEPPVSAPQVEQRKLKPLAEFRSSNVVAPGVIKRAQEVTLRLNVASDECTGTIINGYLVTAAHCLPVGDNDSIQMSTWQDGFAQSHGGLGSWSIDRHYDLLVGKLSWDDGSLPNYDMGVISDTPPQSGDQFVDASLAGDSRVPNTATMTFLRSYPESSQGPARWVFAVNPENYPSAANTVCAPGASGSLVVDNAGNIGVMVSSTIRSVDNPPGL